MQDEDRRTFSAMVSGVDMAVGRVMEALEDYDLYANSVILFSSDVRSLH